MRGLVHFAAVLALAAVAIALGRWLRDPQPGGPLLALLAAALLCGVALRRLYRPGGLGRRVEVEDIPLADVGLAKPAAPPPLPPPPADERLDLNAASADELKRLPGIGPVGAGRIVEEREANGRFRSVGDLVRVAGFGPSRIHGLGNRVRVG